MTEQEIAAALLRHRVADYHDVGDSYVWWDEDFIPVDGIVGLVPNAIFRHLKAASEPSAHMLRVYRTPQAAYADLANAYRLAYPAPTS